VLVSQTSRLALSITLSGISGGTEAPVNSADRTACAGGSELWQRNASTARRRARCGCILEMMKPARAATRRFLPTSPFKPPPDAPPAEQFAVQDQVSHDKYGLGRVVSVEGDTALVIDFGTSQVRITIPCAKLIKL
jgi:hypothetical protein